MLPWNMKHENWECVYLQHYRVQGNGSIYPHHTLMNFIANLGNNSTRPEHDTKL